MAKRAQVDALAVTYGVQPVERLQPEGPLACFNTFDQVCEWLR
jgi:phosphoglycolate phosphatase-like HAD superfamily hydrolase